MALRHIQRVVIAAASGLALTATSPTIAESEGPTGERDVPAQQTGSATLSEPVTPHAIERLIFDWAIAFNDGQTDVLCNLFSHELVARVRGEPVRGRQEMCAHFEAVAGDPTTRLTYAPHVEDVLIGEDLIVADVVWLLRVERGVVDTRFLERTQYVFAREDETWRVVRLQAYVEPDPR